MGCWLLEFAAAACRSVYLMGSHVHRCGYVQECMACVRLAVCVFTPYFPGAP